MFRSQKVCSGKHKAMYSLTRCSADYEWGYS